MGSFAGSSTLTFGCTSQGGVAGACPTPLYLNERIPLRLLGVFDLLNKSMKVVKSVRQRAPIWNLERGNMFQRVTASSSRMNLKLYNEFY